MNFSESLAIFNKSFLDPQQSAALFGRDGSSEYPILSLTPYTECWAILVRVWTGELLKLRLRSSNDVRLEPGEAGSLYRVRLIVVG